MTEATERADSVEDLPDIWREQAEKYTEDDIGMLLSIAVGLCADELEEVLEKQ